jgi:undecaprenyl diphosphate synthase
LKPLYAQPKSTTQSGNVNTLIQSSDVSRIDLIIRWGGRRRLSGFLPVQSVYSDIYVVDDYWPDFKPEHFFAALDWYDKQDITLGG